MTGSVLRWRCSRVHGDALDVGCGEGEAAILLAREGHRVVGLDSRRAAVEGARERLAGEEQGIKELVDFKVGDPGKLPFDDRAFDTVLLGELFLRQVNRERPVAEVRRVLRPGGRLIVSVPYAGDPGDDESGISLQALLGELAEFSAKEITTIEDRLCLVAERGRERSRTAVWRQALGVAEGRLAERDAAAEALAVSLADLEAERDREQRALAEARGDVERLEAALAAAAHERDRRENEARLASEGVAELEARLERLQRDGEKNLAEAESERDREVAAAESERDREITAAESERDREVAAAEAKRVELEHELKGARSAAQAAERELAEARSNLEARKGHLENAQIGVESRDRKLEAANESLGAVRAELAADRARLELREEELERARAVAQEKARELEEARAATQAAERDLAEARSSLERQEGHLENARVGIESRDHKLEEAHRALEVEAGRLESAHEATRRAEQELVATRARLEAREEELERTLAGFEETKGELTAAKSKLAERERDLMERERELDIAREWLTDRERELSAASDLLDTQGEELANTRREVEEEIQRAQAAVEEKEHELEAERATAQAAERELADARTHLAARERHLRTAQIGVESRDRKLVAASRAQESRQAELDRLRAALAGKEREGANQERKLAVTTARLEKARSRAERFESSLVAIREGRGYRLMRVLWRLRRPFKRAPRELPPEGGAAEEDADSSPPSADPSPLVDSAPLPTAEDAVTVALRPSGPELNGAPRLKVAAILDEMSAACFAPECDLVSLTLDGWREQLDEERPDLLLVESAWNANGGEWQYRIAKYPRKDLVGLPALRALLDGCRERGIPTAFWNKEDPVHFDRFKEAAPLFDHVFTTDARCVEGYRELPGEHTVTALPFAAQPRIHNPIAIVDERSASPCFAGAWYRDRHPDRRRNLEALLDAARPFGLVVYDRNLNIEDPAFGFPERFQPHVLGNLPYERVLEAYKSHRLFLNANSVVDSPTMCSRRVFELAACDTAILSTPGVALTALLGGVIDEVADERAATEALERLLGDERERARRTRAARRAVFAEHTYAARLATIADRVGLDSSSLRHPPFAAPGASSNGAANGKSDRSPWVLRRQDGIVLSAPALADLRAATSFVDAGVIGAHPARNGDRAIEHRYVEAVDPRAVLVRRELVESRGWPSGSPEEIAARLREWSDGGVSIYAADADLLV